MLSKFVAPFRRRLSSGSRRALPPHTSRPLVEILEDRLAPATLPTGFNETQVVSGLPRPTAMEFAPDGRIFVDEQGGNLVVIKNGALLSTPFASFTVDSSGERGLLGITFDPNFNSNHFLYVYYTATTPTIHNRVSRLTASTTSDTAVAGSEMVLMDLPTLGATNHNGGALHFGPDGDLYIAVGNNAVNSNSQSLNTPLGKMLRIQPNGQIPTDNPFYNVTTGNNQAIWALGLRNPFTFAFQPGTGRIFINDVGENTWEEIDEGVAGSNYGWPNSEGFKQPGDQATTIGTYRDPLFEYGHGTGNISGQAIVGGTFYNPTTSTFPAFYSGTYFFEDLTNGWIRNYDPATGAVTSFATGLPSTLVDLDVGPDGALYSLAQGSGGNTGTLSRIQYTSDPGVIDFGMTGYSETGSGWSSFGAGFGGSLRDAGSGSGANTATWSFTGLASGSTFNAQVDWLADPNNRASNATYSIYDGSTFLSSVTINQRQSPVGTTLGGVTFQSLGAFTVTSGTLKIVLSDNANGLVIADAARLTVANLTPPAILDNGQSGYSETGSGWSTYTGAGFNGNLRDAGSGSGANTATWAFSGLSAGTYNAQVDWLADPNNRASNAIYQVFDGSTFLGSVTINQRQAPVGTSIGGVTFQSLGTFTVNSGTLKIVLSDNANGLVIADAARLTVAPPTLPAIIDNLQSGYNETGSGWSSYAAGYGGGLRDANSGNGANTVTWSFTGLSAGAYNAQVDWLADPNNRASNATYNIFDGSTLIATVVINQRQNSVGTSIGGVIFQSLGRFTISSGTLSIVLSDKANGLVIADAAQITT